LNLLKKARFQVFSKKFRHKRGFAGGSFHNNSKEENEQLQKGIIPEKWKQKPSKLAQKDIQASFTKKHNKTSYYSRRKDKDNTRLRSNHCKGLCNLLGFFYICFLRK
jgi:hypothetical protein